MLGALSATEQLIQHKFTPKQKMETFWTYNENAVDEKSWIRKFKTAEQLWEIKDHVGLSSIWFRYVEDSTQSPSYFY
jgi:hypothetical protein